MIPLLVSGAVSLASDVMDAWKAHQAKMDATKAANQITGGPEFQQALTAAATQAVAAAQQQQQAAVPHDMTTVASQILAAPDVQSMARTSATGTLSLRFNSSGDVYAAQVGGAIRRLNVSTDIRQQLQQLSHTLHSSPVNPASATSSLATSVGSSHTPIQVTLTAM